MKKVLLIAGHINIQFNSITALHGNTGTAGEQEINLRIANRLATVLRDKGLEVTQSDANANDDPTITSKDFDLALALHCDMDVQNDAGGGMMGSGDKSVDAMWEESKRIKEVMEGIYFPETQIVNKGFATVGMTKYYMWQYLSAKTPCVLVEMGQAKDPHDSVLLSNTDLIANALSKAITTALGVVPTETLPSPCAELVKSYEKTIMENQISMQNSQATIKQYQSDIEAGSREREVLVEENQKLSAQVEYYLPYKSRYEAALTKTIDKFTGRQLISMGVKKLLTKSK